MPQLLGERPAGGRMAIPGRTLPIRAAIASTFPKVSGI